MKQRRMQKSLRIALLMLLLYSGLHATPEVSIHYLGHSSFILEFDNGVTVLTDYGTSNCWGLSSPIYDIGDFVPTILTYSHRHDDHYNEDRKPAGVSYQLEGTDSLDIDGLSIRPMRLCEGVVGVESSTAFIFSYKGFSVCHLGDAQADIMAIEDKFHQTDIRNMFSEKFDLLLMTIEGIEQFIPEAEIFVNVLKPYRIIAMHYWTVQYKTRFFDHLENQNSLHDRNYVIHDIGSADYSLSSEDPDVLPVQVINLDPAAYAVSGIDDSKKTQIPFSDKLFQNYPNPFNPSTEIRYTLQTSNNVKITVLNMIGELVETLVDDWQFAGEYSVRWDASNYSSGTYLYRIQAGDFTGVKQCLLIK